MSIIRLIAGFSLAMIAAHAAEGRYRIRLDQPRQVIRGIGFEIQSDSIGSDNLGLPDKTVAVPHDLVPSERARLYRDMLKGFRFCRLAMGLYLRGLDPTRSRIIERYPGQMRELKELMDQSGIEGFAPEYWSPAPHWKSNESYRGGSLKEFDPEFLAKFADALVDDVRYLEAHGLRVSMWGLQNEPVVNHEKYSTCSYTGDQYYRTMKVVGPKIKAAFPSLPIHADSWEGQHSAGGKLIRQDPELLRLTDFWTWHRIGQDSNDQIQHAARYTSETAGKPVFSNEFEYLEGPASDLRCINTAQSIMNWFVFEESPTWFWLHALKPTYNAEASGYALGFWRPADDHDMSRHANIQPGYWDYNVLNWSSLVGFLKHLPWDSVRLAVDEDDVRGDNRILAWRAPDGRLGVALTNRSGAPFRFRIDANKKARFQGWRYTPSQSGMRLAAVQGPEINIDVPDLAIEFWLESGR